MQPADAGHREGRHWALPQQQQSAAGRSEREHGVNGGKTSEYTGSSDCPCRATTALAIKFQKLPASFLYDFRLDSTPCRQCFSHFCCTASPMVLES